MVTCLYIFHTPKSKECWGCKKSSCGPLAKVRIKTDTSDIEIPLTAEASQLQHWKGKSLGSHYFLPKVLEYLATVSISSSCCKWIANALFLHDFYKQRGIFLSISAFKIPSHVSNTENIPCNMLDSEGDSGRLGESVCSHCLGTSLPSQVSEGHQSSSASCWQCKCCFLLVQRQGRRL